MADWGFFDNPQIFPGRGRMFVKKIFLKKVLTDRKICGILYTSNEGEIKKMTIVSKILVSDEEIQKIKDVAELLDQIAKAKEDDVFYLDCNLPCDGDDLRELASFLKIFRDKE